MVKNILMISGEASGDLHGSSLIKALKRIAPSVSVKGMGGRRMREAGLEGIDSTKLSVVGIVEVFTRFSDILHAFSELKNLLCRESFDCVVLIDYPDFNLRFAKVAKKKGVPVVYYISPQVWAWRRNRIYKIAKLVDKMLVVFPFEEPLYRKVGVDVEYVGHPLVGEAVCNKTKEEARAALGVPAGRTVVAVLPGSRVEEIRRHLDPMVRGVELFQKEAWAPVEVLLPAAEGVERAFLDELLRECPLEVRIIRRNTYTALRAADAAVVASGTATLETALVGTPMLIVYRVSPLSYLIGRLLIGVDNIGLPNIVCGKRIVPELIQNEVTPENIARELSGILRDPERRRTMEEGYKEVRGKLRGLSAPERAAAAVCNLVCGSVAESTAS